MKQGYLGDDLVIDATKIICPKCKNPVKSKRYSGLPSYSIEKDGTGIHLGTCPKPTLCENCEHTAHKKNECTMCIISTDPCYKVK